MITICKDQIYPHCTIVESLPFQSSVYQSASSCQYLQTSQRALLPAPQRARKSPYACNDFNAHPSRFVRWSWVCRQEHWFKMCVCVCVWTQNGLPVQSENGCQGGESKLFAHVQTCRMDEDTDGISLWRTFLLSSPLCVWRDMETSAGMDRHLIEWGKT